MEGWRVVIFVEVVVVLGWVYLVDGVIVEVFVKFIILIE